MATRGFSGKRPGGEDAKRLPPGQSKTEDFPVLSMGPTPRVDLGAWRYAGKPRFWEQRGYHIDGDPWREQRYTDDP
jgi:DMSO/TMAO reductase YedYZ molybdopterin-dependent catalytic subunit